MEDNSSIFAKLGSDDVTALTAGSCMAAGNTVTRDSDSAMTAPGSLPADPLPDRSDQADPRISAKSYDTPVLVGPGGTSRSPDNATRSDPYSEDGGDRWRQQPAKTWGPA